MNTRAVVTQLVTEMKALRKSRGINVRGVEDRVGTALRTAFGVTTDDGPAEVRHKVGSGLARLADGLPDDLRLAVLAAFALVPGATQPFYQARARWAANQLDRDERTVRRRVDEGILRLAELAAGQAAGSHGGADEPPGGRWHSEALRALLVLDRPAAEAFEFRRIVADQDDLSELDLSVTLTAPEAGARDGGASLSMDVLYGGSLVRRSMASARRFSMALALPHPLRRAERHEFGLRFRVPEGQVMRPHFVCVTTQECDLLEVRVKFDEKKLPIAVWRLTKVFKDELDDPALRGDEVTVDACGESRVTFRQVSPGFGYGVQWDGADPAGPA